MGPGWMVGVLVLLFTVSVVAQEITVFNFSGGNVTTGPLTFPVGQWSFAWPYGPTNLAFTYRNVAYSFPVTGDFHLLIDRQRVYQTAVMSTTEWFFTGFGLAMTIAGFFWVVRIVNQLFKANPEVQ
jgi:hypothetical protein